MRYFQRLNANRIFSPQIITDLGYATTYFTLSFNKLKELSKDLFAIGDIETLDYCLEIYRQHSNHEKLDFFIADKWEIKDCLKTIERTLLNLEFNLNKIFSFIYTLFPKNSKFRKRLTKNRRII